MRGSASDWRGGWRRRGRNALERGSPDAEARARYSGGPRPECAQPLAHVGDSAVQGNNHHRLVAGHCRYELVGGASQSGLEIRLPYDDLQPGARDAQVLRDRQPHDFRTAGFEDESELVKRRCLDQIDLAVPTFGGKEALVEPATMSATLDAGELAQPLAWQEIVVSVRRTGHLYGQFAEKMTSCLISVLGW